MRRFLERIWKLLDLLKVLVRKIWVIWLILVDKLYAIMKPVEDFLLIILFGDWVRLYGVEVEEMLGLPTLNKEKEVDDIIDEIIDGLEMLRIKLKR